MTSLARKSLFVLAGIVVVVVLGAGIFLLTFDADQYCGYILEPLSQTLGRPVEAAGLELGLFPLSLTLNDIRVAKSADMSGEDLLSAQAVEVQVTLSSLLSGAPVVSGQISLSDATVQPDGWSRPFTIQQADLEFGPDQVELQNLQVTIAGGTLEGFLRVNDWDAPKVVFELSGDYFDVTELQNSMGYSQEPSGRGAGEAGQGMTWFNKVTGEGQLKLGQLKHGTLILEPFEAAVQIAEGQVICEPISFGLYGGTGSGRLQIDLSKSEPSSTFSVELEKVDANQMLSANTESKDRLFGNLHASLELAASGGERDRIFQTANGQGTLQLTEGGLGALNLGKELADLNSLVGLPFTETGTQLEEFFTTFSVEDGWIRTEDLLIRTPKLAMGAVGRLSLSGELDFEASAAFTPEASQQLSNPLASLFSSLFTDQYNRIVIPFDIQGNFKQPQFKLDAGRLAMIRLGVFLTKPPEPAQEETTPE